MDARRLHNMRWKAWLLATVYMCAIDCTASRTAAPLPSESACALTNRIEKLRSSAMANAYYLRSAYLRHTAVHAAASGRALPDAKNRILDAILLLGYALGHEGTSARLWWEYAALNTSVGNVGNVIEAYEHLSVLDPTADVLAKLGGLYELRGQPDRAVATYLRSLGMDASNVIARERIVNVYVEQGLHSFERGDRELGHEQLRRALDELTRLDDAGDHGRQTTKKALLYELLGDEDAALRAYTAASAQDPDDPEPLLRASKIHFARGERLHRQGRTNDAAAQYTLAACMATNAVPSQQDKPEFLNYTAYVLALADIDLSLAEKLVRAAIATDDGNGAYMDTLGWINYRQGSFADALKRVLRARELEGDDPIIIDHLGDIYRSLGQPDKARQMWEQSLRMDDANQQVRDKLKTCALPPH